MVGVHFNGVVLNNLEFSESHLASFHFKISENGKRIFTIGDVVQQSGVWLVRSQEDVFYLVYIQTKNTLYRVTARKIEFKETLPPIPPPVYSLNCHILNPNTGYQTPYQPDVEIKHYLFQRLGANANEQTLYDEQQAAEVKIDVGINSQPASTTEVSPAFLNYFQEANQTLYVKSQNLGSEHITFATHIFPWFESVMQPLCQRVENKKLLLDSLKLLLVGVNPKPNEPLSSEICYINEQLTPLVLGQMATNLKTKNLDDLIHHGQGTITVALSAEQIYYFCLNLLFFAIKTLSKELEPEKEVEFVENRNNIAVSPTDVILIPYLSFVPARSLVPVIRQTPENFSDEQQVMLEILYASCHLEILNMVGKMQFKAFSGKLMALFSDPDNLVLNEFVASLAAEGHTVNDIGFLKDKINTQVTRVWASHITKFQPFYENDIMDCHTFEWASVTKEELYILISNIHNDKRSFLFDYLNSHHKFLWLSMLRETFSILKLMMPSGFQYFSLILKQYFNSEQFALIHQAAQTSSFADVLLLLNNISQEHRFDFIDLCSIFITSASNIVQLFPFFPLEKQLEIALFWQNNIKNLFELIMISGRLSQQQNTEFLLQFNFSQMIGYQQQELETIKYLMKSLKYVELTEYLHTFSRGKEELYQNDMLQFITGLDSYQALTSTKKVELLTRTLSNYKQLKIILPYLPENEILPTLKAYGHLIPTGYQLFEILETNIYDGKYNAAIAMEFKDRIDKKVEADSEHYKLIWDKYSPIRKLGLILSKINDPNGILNVAQSCAHFVENISHLDLLLKILRGDSYQTPSVEKINILDAVAICFKDKINTAQDLKLIALHFNLFNLNSLEYKVPNVIKEKSTLISTFAQVLEIVNCIPWQQNFSIIIQHFNFFSTVESVDLLFQHQVVLEDHNHATELMIKIILSFHSLFKLDIDHYSTILCRILNRIANTRFTSTDIPAVKMIGCFLAIHDIEFLKYLSNLNKLNQDTAAVIHEIIYNVEIAEKKLQNQAFPNKLSQSPQEEIDLYEFRTIVDDFLEKPPQLPQPRLFISYLNSGFPASPVEKYVALCNAHDNIVCLFSNVKIKELLPPILGNGNLLSTS